MKHATHKIIENFKSVRSLPFLGIPVALEYGIYLRKFQHIVLPHFKSTVWSLFNENGQKMPMHTLFRLAIQMINAYEFVHSRKLIHGDLSGNHIMIDDSGMAYLIDYTSALPYVTETYKENPKYFDHGTREYCSYDMHLVSFDFILYDVLERVCNRCHKRQLCYRAFLLCEVTWKH